MLMHMHHMLHISHAKHKKSYLSDNNAAFSQGINFLFTLLVVLPATFKSMSSDVQCHFETSELMADNKNVNASSKKRLQQIKVSDRSAMWSFDLFTFILDVFAPCMHS